MSTAQNTRTTLAAITKVAEGQLLEFSDSDDDDVLYPEEVVCGEGNQDNNDAGENDPSSSEGEEGNVLASFTNRKTIKDKSDGDPKTRRTAPNCPYCLSKGK
jgi:hypothetical protein